MERDGRTVGRNEARPWQSRMCCGAWGEMLLRVCLSLSIFIYEEKERKGGLYNKGKRKSFWDRRMLQPLEELLSMVTEIPRKYGCSVYRNVCVMALIQSPYLVNEVNHSPHILGSMRTAPSIDFIWVYLQNCSAISWWVNWNLSNKTLHSNSSFPSAMCMPVQTEGKHRAGEKWHWSLDPSLLLEWQIPFSCQQNSLLESSHRTDLTCLCSCLGEGHVPCRDVLAACRQKICLLFLLSQQCV